MKNPAAVTIDITNKAKDREEVPPAGQMPKPPVQTMKGTIVDFKAQELEQGEKTETQGDEEASINTLLQ